MALSLKRCTEEFNIAIWFLFPTDIDECFHELDDCDNALTECINIPGSYMCSCYKQNYAWDGDTCVGKGNNLNLENVALVCLKVLRNIPLLFE